MAWVFHAFGWITFIGVIIGYIPYSLTLGYFLYYSLKSFKNKTMSITMLFTFYDYSRSIGFLAYPWGLAAFTVNNFNNLIQVADILVYFCIICSLLFKLGNCRLSNPQKQNKFAKHSISNIANNSIFYLRNDQKN